MIALGVLSYFRLERHSFESTNDFEFLFLERTHFLELVVGLLITLIGGVLLAWRAAISEVASFGVGIVAVTVLTLATTPINIHGWTGALLFVGIPMILIGGLLLVVAAFRAFMQRRRASSG